MVSDAVRTLVQYDQHDALRWITRGEVKSITMMISIAVHTKVSVIAIVELHFQRVAL
jgi:hypothetical protein